MNLGSNKVSESPRPNSSSYNNSQDPVILKQTNINGGASDKNNEKSFDSSVSDSEYYDEMSNGNEDTNHNGHVADAPPQKK